MAEIIVTCVGHDKFRVVVAEGNSTTTVHDVTAMDVDSRRYGSGVSTERLIEVSFEFLLEREPKESILTAFDLPMIERYFPEYPREMRRRLG